MKKSEQILLNNYTERGVEKGAKLSGKAIDNPDLRLFWESTAQDNLRDTLAWVKSHRNCLSDKSRLVTQAEEEKINKEKGLFPMGLKEELGLILIETPLHAIPHLNTLLGHANEALEQGGYLWCHLRTAVLKRKLIMQHYPWGINGLVFLFHFIWHRIFPKLNITRPLYFAVTRGKKRTYNRVEVLGRLYRAGFEVVDEEFREGTFYVVARKVKDPIRNDTPSGSPLITMRRVGKDRQLISIYKFRTMYSYSEYLQPYIYEHNHLDKDGKFADDYRVTPWGRWMRKLWIDELPMIWNVLRGDLKLVGVRPLSPHYFSLYTPEMQELRTRTKPGLLPPAHASAMGKVTLKEIQETERIYLEQYMKHPFKTDWVYFWRIVTNILFKGARSK